MSRRQAVLLIALALVVLVVPLPAEAHQPGRVWRIGYLPPVSASTAPPREIEAFRHGLRERGYVERQNIVIEVRAAGGRPERLTALVSELVQLNVDVIVATGIQSILAAKRATTVIPIVMTLSGDAVGAGLVASLARPGGNVTGLTSMAPDLGSKRLQLLKEAVPRVSRVALLWNPTDPLEVPEYKETQTAAKALRVDLQSFEVRGAWGLTSAFSEITRSGPDALVTSADPGTAASRALIVDFAEASRLPAMYGLREFAEAGGLMSYGPDVPDVFRRAAIYVDKILKGAKPADLPVERPTKFDLVVNMKTAKALGLTIPPTLLIRAVQVIE